MVNEPTLVRGVTFRELKKQGKDIALSGRPIGINGRLSGKIVPGFGSNPGVQVVLEDMDPFLFGGSQDTPLSVKLFIPLNDSNRAIMNPLVKARHEGLFVYVEGKFNYDPRGDCLGRISQDYVEFPNQERLARKI